MVQKFRAVSSDILDPSLVRGSLKQISEVLGTFVNVVINDVCMTKVFLFLLLSLCFLILKRRDCVKTYDVRVIRTFTRRQASHDSFIRRRSTSYIRNSRDIVLY